MDGVRAFSSRAGWGSALVTSVAAPSTSEEDGCGWLWNRSRTIVVKPVLRSFKCSAGGRHMEGTGVLFFGRVWTNWVLAGDVAYDGPAVLALCVQPHGTIEVTLVSTGTRCFGVRFQRCHFSSRFLRVAMFARRASFLCAHSLG